MAMRPAQRESPGTISAITLIHWVPGRIDFYSLEDDKGPYPYVGYDTIGLVCTQQTIYTEMYILKYVVSISV